MPYTIDYRDGDVVTWTLTEDGVDRRVVPDYRPRIYVSAADRDALDRIAGFLERDPRVVAVDVVAKRTGWRHDPEPVLALALAGIDQVRPVAHDVRGWGETGDYRLYNVDLAREFRYHLETSTPHDSAVPAREPTTLAIGADRRQVETGDIAPLRVGDETLAGEPREVLAGLADRLAAADPDVLVLSTAGLVPLLSDRAAACRLDDFALGRRPGYRQRAGASTYEQYGQVGHSNARHAVPGRAVVDRANCFWWDECGLDGLLYLVEQSGKPLQEAAWASIGNVLSSIEIRHALDADVLVPWRSWRHEFVKPLSTLHDADRGGVTLSPAVGVHEDVVECDFSSLYPNIMITRNVSPETVRCDCCDTDDVPGLGYSICSGREGFIVDVLGPLVAERERLKRVLRRRDEAAAGGDADATAADATGEAETAMQGKIDAIRWIGCACFGYQGFANAKFGRIECHEAINAYARRILLDAKATFEDHGYRVLHGIVDSIWVQPRAADPTPVAAVAERITDQVGITLDVEAHYDWVAFVPERDGAEGALTRYVGKRADGDYKLRGVDARQRSTPAYVADCQRTLIEVFDDTRAPQPVCDTLRRQCRELRRGAVDPGDLVIRTRVSQPLEAYAQRTRTTAALRRAADREHGVAPGQDIAYVVVDDAKRGRERVRLAFEPIEAYDADFYTTLLLRAAESILAPVGWDRERIRRELADTDATTLAAFG